MYWLAGPRDRNQKKYQRGMQNPSLTLSFIPILSVREGWKVSQKLTLRVGKQFWPVEVSLLSSSLKLSASFNSFGYFGFTTVCVAIHSSSSCQSTGGSLLKSGRSDTAS